MVSKQGDKKMDLQVRFTTKSARKWSCGQNHDPQGHQAPKNHV